LGEMTKEEDQRAFLKKSGFEQYRNRMLGSMTLKDFLLFVEERACVSELGEVNWVEQFMDNLVKSQPGFLDRVNETVKPYEMTPYEQRQWRLKKDADKKAKEEEAAKENGDA
jgi:hypothetical protein